MPNIQVKNVPPEVHKVLKRRAVEKGQSLQEYLLAKLTEDAGKPSLEELFKRIESRRGGGRAPTDEVVRLIRQDRESH